MVKLVIVGAGIGGLVLARVLALLKPFEIRVYEQAPVFSRVGHCLALNPQSVELLHRLGLGEEIEWHGGRLYETVVVTTSGRRLSSVSLPATQRSFIIHRADLHQILVNSLETPGGKPTIHLGTKVSDVAVSGNQAKISFDTGVVEETDILVGSDGINSSVVAHLYGPQQKIFYETSVILGTSSPLPDGHKALELLRNRRYKLIGPGTNGTLRYAGHNRINWSFFVRSSKFGIKSGKQSWSQKASETILMKIANEIAEPFRNVLLEHTSINECLLLDACDRPSMPQWVKGRSVIIGDAAHPGLPGIGVNMAIEDALVLGKYLSQAVEPAAKFSIDDALQAFERERKPRTSEANNTAKLWAQAEMQTNPLLFALRAVQYYIGLRSPLPPFIPFDVNVNSAFLPKIKTI